MKLELDELKNDEVIIDENNNEEKVNEESLEIIESEEVDESYEYA